MAKSDKSWLQRFRESESSTSVIFGAIVVIVVGILLFNYSRSNPTISDQGEATISASITSPTGKQLPTTHEVVKGETLWGIATTYYGDGGKWTDLVKENNLAKNGIVEVGQVLKIPALSSASSELATPEVASTPVTTPEPTSVAAAPTTQATNYTVAAGDSLWKIAVSVYKDGYRWVDIYKANKTQIANPNLIYPNQVLVLPQ